VLSFVINIDPHIYARIPVATPYNWFAPLNHDSIFVQLPNPGCCLGTEPGFPTRGVQNAAVIEDGELRFRHPFHGNFTGEQPLEIEVFP